ncbi:DNA adenine methylase [Yersinia intermedia]|uniref:DNA adenine methylase n=1 Tax=Yersinia intermedia TaxID=631 RepID=UPI00065D526B|nr:Dam family site-specific DNA-(adenine-N6)-methyltransferase [Yersinia intermedia]CRY83969.1 DNA adenine methylase [Yersinia intermedia]
MMHKSVLKWAGGKAKVIPFIKSNFVVDPDRRWVEPFMGGGSVFLNIHAQDYLLADINKDLVTYYKTVQSQKVEFIECVKSLFSQCTTAEQYSKRRDEFNKLKSECIRKAALFFYLNRAGYNGLCRYNIKGEYNVPFGQPISYKVPEEAFNYLCFKLAAVEVTRAPYELLLPKTGQGDQIYCDPPYAKLNASSFTKYSGNEFTKEDQTQLADLLVEAHGRGAKVGISNNLTPVTEELYRSRGFKIYTTDTYRSIAAAGTVRTRVKEILAVLE